MEGYSEAETSFNQGIQALTSLFRGSPAPYADLLGNLCRGYLEAAKQSHQPPDMNLLAPMFEVFDKIEHGNNKERTDGLH